MRMFWKCLEPYPGFALSGSRVEPYPGFALRGSREAEPGIFLHCLLAGLATRLFLRASKVRIGEVTVP